MKTLKMKKMFIVIALSFLVGSKVLAFEYGNFYEKNTDITIVRNKEKIEKYSNLFVKFMPDYFRFDENKNLIYYSTDSNLREKQSNNIKIIETNYNSNLDFNIYVIVQYEVDNDVVFNYFRMFADINDKSYNRDGKFFTEIYFSEDSLFCFFGIVSNTDCVDKTHFFKSKNIDIKLLKEFLNKQ